MKMINSIENLRYKDSDMFFLLAGPCVVESEKNVMEIANTILNITNKFKIPFIFKASYRKANRSKKESFQGIGDKKALKILKKVREELKLPVVTDIHTANEADMAASYADVLQIPAFLCRQTDLLEAAGKSGRFINIKKGQFLAPSGMRFAIEKVIQTGNENVMITERGTTFGYQDLIVDYRGFPEMRSFGKPLVLDITHSLQRPNQSEGVTGGRPELIETLARAGIACNVDGIFIETHPEPAKAKSDGANMLPLNKLEALLKNLTILRETVNYLKS